MDFHPGGERPRVRIEAFEGGQQRRVDVEQASVPAPDKPGRQQSHEPGEADEIDAVSSSTACIARSNASRSLPCAAWSTTAVAMPAARACGKAGGVGAVRENERDFGRELRRLRRLDQRRHVGAAAGNEDGDTFLHHALTRRNRGVRKS